MKYENARERAYVSNIQHFCVHDGKGFRTTVFLQGCSLRCAWCQNPELQSFTPVHMFSKSKCAGCGACIAACQYKNLAFEKNGFRPIDKSICNLCMDESKDGYAPCERECFFDARSFSAHSLSAKEVFTECLKESQFYGDMSTGGGCTLSGGEPLTCIGFCMAMGHLCKEHDVSLAVETSGYVAWNIIEKVSPYVDTFLYDVKLVNKSKREKWLVADMEKDIDNLTKLASIHHQIVIRIPLIPLVNDTDDEFDAMMRHIDDVGGIHDIHILPFHQMGASKYDAAGMSYRMNNWKEDNEERVVTCQRIAEHHGYKVSVGGTAFY